MIRLLPFLVVLGLACGVMAKPHAAPGDGDHAAPLPSEKTWTIAPGQSAKVNLDMPAGSEAMADYQTDGASIDWNVHSHPGKDEVVADEGDGPTGSLAFKPPEAGAYSLLFQNKKGKKPVQVTVKLKLSGGARIESLEP